MYVGYSGRREGGPGINSGEQHGRVSRRGGGSTRGVITIPEKKSPKKKEVAVDWTDKREKANPSASTDWRKLEI